MILFDCQCLLDQAICISIPLFTFKIFKKHLLFIEVFQKLLKDTITKKKSY